MKIDFDLSVRYLGLKSTSPDAATAELIRSCIEEIKRTAVPRQTYRRFTVERKSNGCLSAGDVELQGADIAERLQGCDEACFVCVTLGHETDMLIKRYTNTALSRAAVMNAVASAAVEGCLEEESEHIADGLADEGLFLAQRYAPGYGDFPLDAQTFLLASLHADKTVGVVLDENGMMLPTKTLTAVFGISAHKSTVRNGAECFPGNCAGCRVLNCQNRKTNRS